MMKSVTESIMYGFVAIDKLVIPFIEKTIRGMLPKIEKSEVECEAKSIVTGE